MQSKATPITLILVGDPKQAIYRWRGKIQQFFNLLDQEHDFSVSPNFSHLETNYRSYDQLVAFTIIFLRLRLNRLRTPNTKRCSATVFQKPNQKKEAL